MKTILHVVDLDVPPKAAYDAVLRPEELSRWWSTRVTADTVEVGGTVDFTFGGDFNPDMKITEEKEPAVVRWRCTGGHDNWADNVFAFEIEELDGGRRARLTFTQEYARELDDVDYGTYNFNWGYYLQSLKDYLETGTGAPFDPSAG